MNTTKLLIRRAKKPTDYMKDHYGDHSPVALLRAAVEKAKAERVSATATPAPTEPMDETDWSVIKRTANLTSGSALGRALERLLGAVHDEPR